MTQKISDANKMIARTVLDIFGGKPNVWSFVDDNKINSIDILSCNDTPVKSVTSYSTVGLSDFTIGLQVGDIPLGLEMVGACRTRYEFFPNILSTCAFFVINSGFKCRPGSTLKNIVDMYYPGNIMQHVLFLPTFGWRKEFMTLEFSTKRVTWLLLVPISDKELDFSTEKGIDALETLFEEKQIDIFDLERKSVL
jgi:hypothetical protein